MTARIDASDLPALGLIAAARTAETEGSIKLIGRTERSRVGCGRPPAGSGTQPRASRTSHRR